MRSLTIELPFTVDLDDKEAKMLIASNLYQKGKLSLGQAAKLCNYSKETFMDLLKDYGVSFFNYSTEDLDDDLSNAEYNNC